MNGRVAVRRGDGEICAGGAQIGATLDETFRSKAGDKADELRHVRLPREQIQKTHDVARGPHVPICSFPTALPLRRTCRRPGSPSLLRS